MHKATKIIEAKGYDFKGASEIAIKVFSEHENGLLPVEFFLDKVITKEEYEKEYANRLA